MVRGSMALFRGSKDLVSGRKDLVGGWGKDIVRGR